MIVRLLIINDCWMMVVGNILSVCDPKSFLLHFPTELQPEGQLVQGIIA
jgi:hypothetical protein